MVRVPTHRAPTHPGEMLLEEFLEPMGLSQRDLADAIHVPYQRVNELVNGRRGVTPSTGLRLARSFSYVGTCFKPNTPIVPSDAPTLRDGPAADAKVRRKWREI